MKKKTRNIIIIIIAIGLMAGVGIGYYFYNKPPADVAGMNPEFKLTATALNDAYEKNEKEANEKYLGKIIEVTGEISSIEKDSTATLVLSTGGNSMSTVRCTLSPHEKTEENSLSVGNPIKLKGKCTGKLFDVVLINCYVIN